MVRLLIHVLEYRVTGASVEIGRIKGGRIV